MRIFILEDEIHFAPRNQIKQVLGINHDLTIARSCEEGKTLYKGPYELLLLDHDMEGNYEYRPDYPNTGMQFVKWLVGQWEQNLPRPHVFIHSHNHVGAANMRSLLESYGFQVSECPFSPGYVTLLKGIK